MRYNKQWICRLDDENISDFKIYHEYGHGVMESPYEEGVTLKIVKCTEFDAWVIAEAMNIELNGTISSRSSWESPNIRYKPV